MKILMVLTSHNKLGDTGLKTGFWLEEFASPYYAFKDKKFEITLASPKGGQPPLDPKSDETDMLKELDGQYHKGADWGSYVEVDGNLVTGQNPASSEAVAREVIKLLNT